MSDQNTDPEDTDTPLHGDQAPVPDLDAQNISGVQSPSEESQEDDENDAEHQ